MSSARGGDGLLSHSNWSFEVALCEVEGTGVTLCSQSARQRWKVALRGDEFHRVGVHGFVSSPRSDMCEDPSHWLGAISRHELRSIKGAT